MKIFYLCSQKLNAPMEGEHNLARLIREGNLRYLPHLSLDCVIFGFHEGQLKVLLLKMKHKSDWSLPGGFVEHTETLEQAADRVLNERTGLSGIFLKQFHVFSDLSRSDIPQTLSELRRDGIEAKAGDWLAQRYISVGFYALVSFSKVVPRADMLSDACEWRDLSDVGKLILDHNQILGKALETMRLQLNYQPIGYNLLPPSFTMPELQRLYEAILGKKLDRRNFQRRMLGFGILRRLPERKAGGAHKAPYLYEFDHEAYKRALLEGLHGGW